MSGKLGGQDRVRVPDFIIGLHNNVHLRYWWCNAGKARRWAMGWGMISGFHIGICL